MYTCSWTGPLTGVGLNTKYPLSHDSQRHICNSSLSPNLRLVDSTRFALPPRCRVGSSHFTSVNLNQCFSGCTILFFPFWVIGSSILPAVLFKEGEEQQNPLRLHCLLAPPSANPVVPIFKMYLEPTAFQYPPPCQLVCITSTHLDAWMTKQPPNSPSYLSSCLTHSQSFWNSCQSDPFQSKTSMSHLLSSPPSPTPLVVSK